MQKIICLVYIFACMRLYYAVKVSEKKVIATDGTLFDVTEVVDDNTDVVILKKDGVIIEQQITQNEQDYVITLLNDTCNVEFQDQENLPSNNTCYEGRIPAEHEVTDNIKAGCGEQAEIRFIEAVECPKDHIQKRFCFFRCYWRYVCRIVWWRKYRCYVERRCCLYC